MPSCDWLPSELLSLTEVAQYLRRAHLPRSVQSLYGRIRRGTIFAVKVGRKWFIPRAEVQRLARQPQKRRHPRNCLPFDLPDDSLINRLAKLTVVQRGRAQLEAQAFLRGIIRARLRRMHPQLSPRAITIKIFEEHGRHDY